MKITRAQSTDGRIFRAVDEGYHMTRAATPPSRGLTPSVEAANQKLAATSEARPGFQTLNQKPTPFPPLPPVQNLDPKQAYWNRSKGTLNQKPLPSLARILRPQAAYRWLLPQIAAITPQYIEMVLRGALAGSHVQQWELFDLMLDSWPELSACQQELTLGVSRLKLIFEPFAEEDEDPTPSAIERCKLVSSALRRMSPDPTADENDLDGTLTDILDGWFRGVTCLEVDWQTLTSATLGTFLAPRATSWVHPICFAFDSDGRLGLRLGGRQGEGERGRQGEGATFLSPTLPPSLSPPLAAFPPHKFLLGIHKSKSGSALGGAILRPLAWWWCAANFSADWLLNLAQVFGLPFRWANYDPTAAQETVDRVCSMLQNMGSAGWAAFPAGTTMQLSETGKSGSDHSPQGELLDRAERYARLLILGQTMSGGQDASKGGGKAFGAVEADVKGDRIDAAARYACRVLNTQLIPSILTLNYGDADESPRVRLLNDDEGDLTAAQRDQTLANAGLTIPVAFLRKKYNIPHPHEGEETIGGAPGKKVEEQRESPRPGAMQFDESDESGPSAEPNDEDRDIEGRMNYADVTRWITLRNGARIPIREGQAIGDAIKQHFAWQKTASPREKWHRAQHSARALKRQAQGLPLRGPSDRAPRRAGEHRSAMAGDPEDGAGSRHDDSGGGPIIISRHGFDDRAHPIALGPAVEPNIRRAFDHFEEAHRGTGGDPQKITAKLRELLHVEDHIEARTKLHIDPGFQPFEQQRIQDHVQEIFDMLPRKLAESFPPFKVVLSEEMPKNPNSHERGSYAHRDGDMGVMTLIRPMMGVSQGTIYHEMGHYIYWSAPEEYRDAIATHLRRRTQGERLWLYQPGAPKSRVALRDEDGYYEDKLTSRYEGLVDAMESDKRGAGIEIPSTRFEHLAYGGFGEHSHPNHPNLQNYLETQAVALSILYHWR